jgi:uncharacterized membrane protein YhaH (DUF805 family)
MKELLNYIQSSFTKWIDFKSRINRFEFFVGLAASGLFFFFNIILSLNLASYFRVNTWFQLINLYILIAILFTFIQIHSLVARRLNDIKVNPYLSFIPFVLGSVYLALKVFVDIDPYGKFIFIGILLLILVSITLLLSESDKIDEKKKQIIIELLNNRKLKSAGSSDEFLLDTPENLIFNLTHDVTIYQSRGMFIANIIDKIENESKWKSPKNEKEHYEIMNSIGDITSAGHAMYEFIAYRVKSEFPNTLTREQIFDCIDYVLMKIK